jgi:hypothetical protein
VKLNYRQVTEVVDALRTLPKYPGRVDWRETARLVSGIVGYRVSTATVRNVATQTRALDAPRAAESPDVGRLLARVKALEAAIDAGREVEARSYKALDARVKKLEGTPGSPAPKFALRGY